MSGSATVNNMELSGLDMDKRKTPGISGRVKSPSVSSKIPKLTPRTGADKPSPRVSKIPSPRVFSRTGPKKSTSNDEQQIPSTSTKFSRSESTIPRSPIRPLTLKPPSSTRSQPSPSTGSHSKISSPSRISGLKKSVPKKKELLMKQEEKSLDVLSEEIFEEVCAKEKFCLADEPCPPEMLEVDLPLSISDSESKLLLKLEDREIALRVQEELAKIEDIDKMSENDLRMLIKHCEETAFCKGGQDQTNGTLQKSLPDRSTMAESNLENLTKSTHDQAEKADDTLYFPVSHNIHSGLGTPIVPPLNLDDLADPDEESLQGKLQEEEEIDTRLEEEKQNLLTDMQNLQEKLIEQQKSSSLQLEANKNEIKQEFEEKLKGKQTEILEKDAKLSDLLDKQQELITKLSEQTDMENGRGTRAIQVAILAVAVGFVYAFWPQLVALLLR